jgi:hypothetical protein
MDEEAHKIGQLTISFRNWTRCRNQPQAPLSKIKRRGKPNLMELLFGQNNETA